MSEITYAIDFGTSNSLLSACKDGEVLPPITMDTGHEDETIFRSLMYFPKGGEPSFGTKAISEYVEEEGEGRFIRSIKKYLPADSFEGTVINSTIYTLEDLIGCFLREVKRRADEHFQQKVTKVVLGRPAKFSFDEKKDALAQTRLKSAAEQAGFKDIHFFAEPMAAAYDYRKTISSEKKVLIVDLGGGTSDFVVVNLQPQSKSEMDVLALGGVSVAGDALDGCLMRGKISQHFASEIQYKLPMSSNTLTMPQVLKFNLSSPADITLMSRSNIMNFLNEVKKSSVSDLDRERLENLFNLIGYNLGFALFEEIERSKREVCETGTANFKFLQEDIEVEETIQVNEFEKFTAEKRSDIINTMDEVMKASQVKNSEIDLVCCTGGTSKIPMIQQELIKRFGQDKIQSHKNFHSVIQGLGERALELS